MPTKVSISLLISILVLGVISMNVFGFLGFGGSEKWKEEVLLSDGRVIVVEREMMSERGGDEWASNRSGTKPKEYRIRFIDPDGSGKAIEWRTTKKSPGTWPELPLILDVESRQPIVFAIVGISDACEIYIKYIYRNGAWIEEALPNMFEKRMSNLFLRLGANMPEFIDLELKQKEKSNIRTRREFKQVGPSRQVCG